MIYNKHFNALYLFIIFLCHSFFGIESFAILRSYHSDRSSVLVRDGPYSIDGAEGYKRIIISKSETDLDRLTSYGSTTNIFGNRIDYTATLLSNGVMVYIGGRTSEMHEVDISVIYLYNTISSTWSVMNTKLTDPIDNRFSHTAVSTPDGQIIIYGGYKSVAGIDNAQVTPGLVVLNTNTEPFEWTIPQETSKIGKVPLLAGHTADLVENYMLVSFGNIIQQNAQRANPNTYIMDIRNYTWVNKIGTNEDLDDEKMNIVIATINVILGTVVTIILIGIGFSVYMWKKTKQESSIFI